MKFLTVAFALFPALLQPILTDALSAEKPIKFAFYYHMKPEHLVALGGEIGFAEKIQKAVTIIERILGIEIKISAMEPFDPPQIIEVLRNEYSLNAYYNEMRSYLPTEGDVFTFLVVVDPLYKQLGEAESTPGERAVVKYKPPIPKNTAFYVTLIHEWGHLLGFGDLSDGRICGAAIRPIMCSNADNALDYTIDPKLKRSIMCLAEKIRCKKKAP